MSRDEFRTRLPRDSRGSRNKYENRERYSTHKYRQRDDRHYPNKNKETSPKSTRHYNFESRDENRNKEMNPKATRHYNFEIREENRNKEMSPKPIRHCNLGTGDNNRNKETSPKPTRNYNIETRDESHRKSRRDEKDNNVQSPPNETRQRYSSRNEQHQEHCTINKNGNTNNLDSENDELRNRHFEILSEENEGERNGKHKLNDECDDAPMNKRRKLDEVVAVNVPQNDIETAMDVTFLNSEVVRSPDEEVIENVSIKGCTVMHGNEIKLVDPRLTSEKYVQVTDMNNRISLSTISGRDVELKLLHYDYTEKIHCTPSSLKSSIHFSEDFVKEVYESIDRQVSNLSPEPGEIIECLDPVSIHINNDGYLKKNVVTEKIIENEKKVTNSENQYLKSNIQTVEDDLELSEDSCDNNDHNPKNRNKSKANEFAKKYNVKQRIDKEVKKCDVIEISKSVDKNQIIPNVIHVNEDITESNSSTHEVMNMVDMKEQDSLITLEDLNVKSQSLCSDSPCIQNFASMEIHSSNAKMITELHELSVITNIENCNTDHTVNNVNTKKLKHGMNVSKNENNDTENRKNVVCDDSHDNGINNTVKLDDKRNSKKQERNSYSTVTILQNIDTLKEDIVHKDGKNEKDFNAKNQGSTITLNDMPASIAKLDNKMCGDNISADVTKKTSACKMDNGNKSKRNEKPVKDSKLSDNPSKRKSRTKKENNDIAKDTNKVTESVDRTNKHVTHEKRNRACAKIKECNDLEKTNRLCIQNDEGRKLSESIKLCETIVKNDENVSLTSPENITKEKDNDIDDIIIVQEKNANEVQREIHTNIQNTHTNSARKMSETKTCNNGIDKGKVGNSLNVKAKSKKGGGKKAKNNTETTIDIENIYTSVNYNENSEGNVNVVTNTGVSIRELELSRMVNFTDKLTPSTETNVGHDKPNADIQSRIDGNIVRSKESQQSECVESNERSFRTSTPTRVTEKCTYSPKLVIDLADNDNSPNISEAYATEQEKRSIQSITSDLDLSQPSNKDCEAPVVRIFVPRKTSKQRKKTSVS
ncbi:hypothetical protein EVAR_83915_1 [Eumeta japonica]|uniref:Uncharacterized protein n=1 Tax=Eumeta variegata TaxID=151549 RepID=A0A4C1URA9_EUMVA|nr:hypothetical protein EVAR_83915_1 [Eumeta japonica]